MIELQPALEPHYTIEEGLETRELYRLVEKAVSELTEKEQTVMNHRFFDEETLKEIGKRLGVSPERIRQIEAKALRRIRHRMRKWLKTKEEREKENQELYQKQQKQDQEMAEWRARQSSDPKPKLRLVAKMPAEPPARPGRSAMDGLMENWYGSLWQDHVNSSAKCLAAAGLKDVRGKMGERRLPEAPKKRKLLTYEEVATITSLPLGTLYSMVHRKELPHYRLSSKTVRFSEEEIHKWIEGGYVPAQEAP